MDILFELFIAFRVSVKSDEAANNKKQIKTKILHRFESLGLHWMYRHIKKYEHSLGRIS